MVKLITSVAISALFFLSASGRAIDLEEVLRRHAQALGGGEKLRQLTSVSIEACVNVGGMSGRWRRYWCAPDKIRDIIELPSFNSSLGSDGDDYWITDEQGLTHGLAADMKSSLQAELVLESRAYLWPESFAGEVTLMDSGVVVDDVVCYHLDIVPERGTPINLFLDATTFLPVETSSATDLAKVRTQYSDFRDIDGIAIPHRRIESTDAGVAEVTIMVEAVELDGVVPDSLFSRPISRSAEQGLAAVVPFEFFENHIFIEVFINGTGPLDFVFDSGAGGLAIERRLLPRLQLQRLGTQEARGIGGADSASLFLVAQLSVADVVLDSVPAYGVDLSRLDEVSGRAIQGAIGYELLSRYIVTVDYDDSLLVLYHKGSHPRESWGQRCDLVIDFRLPYLEGVVNDSIRGLFRLDTGSRSSLDLNSPFVEQHSLLDTLRQRYATTRLIGLGGELVNLVSFLPSFELCESRVESLFVSFATAASGLFAGGGTAGNIGNGLLQGFAVTFDYNHEAVYFKKGNRFARIGRVRNMAGLLLAEVSDTIAVREVLSEGAAWGVLEVGDLIVRVNGESTIGKTVADVNWMLVGPAGSQVRVEFMRRGAWFKRQVTLSSFH